MHRMTVSELASALARREFSSVELTRHFLERIEAHDGQLNGFSTVTAERALAQAEAADARRARGEVDPLTGVPYAHKDIFCVKGVRTTCGSRMLADFVAPYDAGVTERLDAAGAVMLGRANMDEFAMGSSNESSVHGPVRNPWETSRVPGGSSGGSAAVVAARLAPFATGTDTGGSIRQPAALCGLTGIKPTYGLVSRYGMIAFASSLDQGGPLALDARDAALTLEAMCGFDPRDSTSIDRPVENYSSQLGNALSGLRLGLPRQFLGEGMEPGVRASIEAALPVLRDLGAELVEVDLPSLALSVPAYYIVAPAECSSNLSRYDGVRFGYRCENPKDLQDLYQRSRAEGFGDEVKRRILIGTYALSAGYYDAYYLKAQKVRRLIRDDFARAFESVDALIGPTAPGVAFRLGEKNQDPVTMYLCDIYTIAVNLAGLPAMSLPCGFSEALPVGMQLIGNYFSEARLLNIAWQYQCATDWHSRIPEAYA